MSEEKAEYVPIARRLEEYDVASLPTCDKICDCPHWTIGNGCSCPGLTPPLTPPELLLVGQAGSLGYYVRQIDLFRAYGPVGPNGTQEYLGYEESRPAAWRLAITHMQAQPDYSPPPELVPPASPEAKRDGERFVSFTCGDARKLVCVSDVDTVTAHPQFTTLHFRDGQTLFVDETEADVLRLLNREAEPSVGEMVRQLIEFGGVPTVEWQDKRFGDWVARWQSRESIGVTPDDALRALWRAVVGQREHDR